MDQKKEQPSVGSQLSETSNNSPCGLGFFNSQMKEDERDDLLRPTISRCCDFIVLGHWDSVEEVTRSMSHR